MDRGHPARDQRPGDHRRCRFGPGGVQRDLGAGTRRSRRAGSPPAARHARRTLRPRLRRLVAATPLGVDAVSTVAIGAFGALAGAGAFLVILGATGRRVFTGEAPTLARRWAANVGVARLAAAAGAALVVVALTGWLAGALLAGIAVLAG